MVGRTGLWIEEVVRGRRKVHNVGFDDLCVGKDDEVTEFEMDGSVANVGV